MDEEELKKRLARARTHLLLDNPWFGSLSLRLRLEVDNTKTETIATDGTSLICNSDYLKDRSDAELKGLLAHEVMHCALGHPWRGKGRKWNAWNQATDIVINKALRDQGFTLPYTELEVEEAMYAGMTSEQVYSKRDKKEQDGEGHGPGCCDLKPGQAGKSKIQGDSQVEVMSETDWQIATEQASAIAKRAGNLPANIARTIATAKETITDWRTILRRFIDNTVPSDYSWASPNRRYISQGLYLPGVIKENLPKIGVAVDTSGSVSSDLLKQFANELTAIMHEARPESIEVIYVDTAIHGMETFTPDDPEIILNTKGGGGTSFQPAIDHFNKEPPVCMIYLTDLEASEPTKPEYPVLWAIPEWQKQDAWFGETVRIAGD